MRRGSKTQRTASKAVASKTSARCEQPHNMVLSAPHHLLDGGSFSKAKIDREVPVKSAFLPYVPVALARLPVSRASLNAHARGLNRRRPLIDFALNETAEILRRGLIVRHNPCAETFEPITHRGRVHRLKCRVM